MSTPKDPLPRHLLERARRLRHDATNPEELLWELLRNRQLEGLKFRRQVVIAPFVVDFYCHEKRLVVEVDGASHIDRAEYDRGRQDWIERQGLHVLRVSNDDVLTDLEAVGSAILRAAELKPS